MITFPYDFVATRYPGYYWNKETKELYSIKVSGILHKMKKTVPNHWNNYVSGYRVSVKGHRRFLPMSYLNTLQYDWHQIPMES